MMSIPLNCSVALNCMDPSNKPQTIPAFNTRLKGPWVFHLPHKHVAASQKSQKQWLSTTEVSDCPGSWLKHSRMMCQDSSIDATCVLLPAYLFIDWTSLNAAEIIRWAKWDISKWSGRRTVLAKSPKHTDSSFSESKNMPFQGAGAVTGMVGAWLVCWGFFATA